MCPIKVERHSIVPIPFLKSKQLFDKMELDSSHQSSQDLSIFSNILHSEKYSALEREEVLEFCLGKGISIP